MAQLLWALTCKRAITDQETNNISYIDAIEQINVPRLPASYGTQLVISSLWRRGDEHDLLSIRHRLIAPSGKELAVHCTDPIEMMKPRYRLNIILGGFDIEEEGEYRFNIDVNDSGNWRTVGDIPISVIVATAMPVDNK